MKRHDTFFLFILSFILLLVGVGLWWRSHAVAALPMPTQMLRLDSLDTERQLVEIKSDSLVVLIQRLQQTNKEVFVLENGNKTIEIKSNSGRETAFNRLFFNDESLQTFAKIKNSGLDINLNSYQFAISKYELGETIYSKVPAEILQSMLLSIEK